MKKPFSLRSLTLSLIAISLLSIIVIITTANSRAQDSLGSRLSGRILLQVEDRGQAWYVNPENEKKYYLGTPEESFALSRQLGFYMDKNILNNYLNNSFPDNYSGRVIINAQETFEAYYINPLDLKALSLNSPQDAFNIMRDLSLGITNEDLKLIKTYNYLDNELFSNEIIDSSFGIEVSVFEPNKMKDFTRIIELSAKVSNPQNRRILERGLVWDYVTIPDVSVNPTLKNNYQRVLSENNSDVFVVKISDLIPGSYPFFRAYVITEDGETIYSEVQTIKGDATTNLPLVPAPSSGTSRGSNDIVEAPKFILNYGAGDGGDIDGPSLQIVDKGDEGEPVIAKAASGYKFVSWSDGSTDQTRVDAPVDSNVVVIAQFELVCDSDTVVYDGVTYNTLAMGEQCWFQENLRTTEYSDGTDIFYPGSDDTAWINDTSGAYACPNDDTLNCMTYGALYNWYAVDNSSGLCPTGWHVPSHEEFTDMERSVCSLGDNSEEVCLSRFPLNNYSEVYFGVDEGKKIKSSAWGGDGSTDFSAIPTDYRHEADGSYYPPIENSGAFFWTSTDDGDTAWRRLLIFEHYIFQPGAPKPVKVDRDDIQHVKNAPKGRGCSVRCVKN